MVKKPKHLRPQPRKSSLTTHAFTFLILALFSILILLGLGILSLPSTSMISSRSDDFTTVERTSEDRESYGDEEGNGERWLEVISWEPRAFLYHNFLTNEECEHLISLAKPNMAKSKVADVKTGRSKDSRVRTSSGAFLKTGHDEIVREIENKISDFTFIPVENGESLQVLHYEVGQKYEPHHDYFTDELNVKRGGQRVATVLMYLSDVDEGGETVFPLAKGNISDVPWWNELSQCGKEGLSVLPKKRDALLFWSMRPDGSLDPSSLHALTCNMEKVDASLRFPHERWPEVISMKPRAILYHNFLKNEECEHLISLAKPYMRRSLVINPITGVRVVSSGRTSTGSSIRRGHDKIVVEIEKRISEFTFLPVENGENLQVIHYEVGQKNDPHFDGLGRIATFLMYLSDVDEGGETDFPKSSGRLSVSPKKGDAVLFWNKRPDGSQDPSRLSVLPLKRGALLFWSMKPDGSLDPSTLTCNMEKVDASLRFPHERWPEVISMKPRAFLYHNFLKNEECEHLISLAKPYMRRSLVSGYGGGKQSSARTSTGSFISRGHDKTVEEIERRISEFTFLPVENGESLQVIHYEIGQKFDPHFDGLGRIATFLMYLSDVDKGGETDFPKSSGRLSVSPKKGDAVLFWNKRPDDSQDPSSFHSGRPVIKGNKWAATKWFHSQEYKGSYTNTKQSK
ncbi:hypothetical protein F2Q68_00028798 [Brassica cretica]|uniref:procollagen-proline 4-dioxygenase n=1 Tax=Brassica cretica TaxID=69181 RepID=A0A8S9GES8_BRACR|nr:hypothetical protein F2Q68_00028798 [Brassica cretica]